MRVGRQPGLVAEDPKGPTAVPGLGQTLQAPLDGGSEPSIGRVAVRNEPVVDHRRSLVVDGDFCRSSGLSLSRSADDPQDWQFQRVVRPRVSDIESFQPLVRSPQTVQDCRSRWGSNMRPRCSRRRHARGATVRHSANGNQTIVRCERLHRDRVDGDTRCVSDGTDRAVGSAHAGNSTDKGSVRKKGNDHEEPHPQDPPPEPQPQLVS